MKSFYVAEKLPPEAVASLRGEVVEFPTRSGVAHADAPVADLPAAVCSPSSARIAIYDAPGSAPRVDEVLADSVGALIEELSARVYEHARALGGSVPFSVVREVSENFIHADFLEPVVSVLDRGNTIRFSDQGPGFADPGQALEPGYTTASHQMKRFIRGVGSGLPLAKECLAFSGGSLCIDHNLGRGAVVTVSVPGSVPPAPEVLRYAEGQTVASPRPAPADVATPESLFPLGLQQTPPSSSHASLRLTNRQKQVLALVMDSGSAGPSLVAKELSVGLSTAYRDLARLESLGLIVSDETGKREITDEGTAYLGGLLNGSF